MGNEKYLNYYIETLTATMTDCVVRNVSMQANAKVTDDVVKEQGKTIEELSAALGEMKDGNKTLIDQLQLENKHLRDEVNELKAIRNQYENVKSEAAHVETFRNELVKERELHQKDVSELQGKINSITNDFNNKINVLNNDFNNKLNKVNLDHKDKVQQLNSEHEKKIIELNNRIAYLELTPAKRKKFDMENAKVNSSDEETAKDGGVF
jgi:uncharacterized coiled-coil protein SlyX